MTTKTTPKKVENDTLLAAKFVSDSPKQDIPPAKKDITGASSMEYSSKNRLALVDNFRGLIIFATVLAWYVAYFELMPWWFPHFYSNKNGIGFADLGVVAFSFILSFMMSYNYKRREQKNGRKATVKHFINRGFILIAVGFTANYFRDIFYNLGDDPSRIYTTWNMIVTYGVCTIIMTAILPIKKTEMRIYIGFALILFYQVAILHIMPLRAWIWQNDQGGPIGVISYLGLMLIVSALGDFYFNEKRKFYISTGIIIAIGVLLIILNLNVSGNHESWDFFSFIFMDKMYQTAAYMITSLAVTLVLFNIFDLIPALKYKKIPLFNRMGQNSIVFYIVGALLLGVALTVGKPIENHIMTGSTLYDMLIGLAIMVPPQLLLAYLFQKTNFRLSL